MEALIGFVVGYLVGTKQGQEGMRKVRESAQAIGASPELRQMVAGGVSVATSAFKQVASGGIGPALTSAFNALTRKAEEVLSTPEDRRAA